MNETTEHKGGVLAFWLAVAAYIGLWALLAVDAHRLGQAVMP